MDRRTYPLSLLVENLLAKEKNKIVLEIGTGSISTPFFYRKCKKYSHKFHTVDIKSRFKCLNDDTMTSHHIGGSDFLKNFNNPVYFCYLDNYDWINHWENTDPEFKGLSKENSEKIHLEQSILLYPKLEENSYILFDDTGVETEKEVTPDYINNTPSIKFYGKGALAIPYLMEKDMKILGYSANHGHGGRPNTHDQILLEKNYGKN